jgi:hypothetical protein
MSVTADQALARLAEGRQQVQADPGAVQIQIGLARLLPWPSGRPETYAKPRYVFY